MHLTTSPSLGWLHKALLLKKLNNRAMYRFRCDILAGSTLYIFGRTASTNGRLYLLPRSVMEHPPEATPRRLDATTRAPLNSIQLLHKLIHCISDYGFKLNCSLQLKSVNLKHRIPRNIIYLAMLVIGPHTSESHCAGL